MKRKQFVKPPVNPCFFAGEIVSWIFREKITPDHGKYCFRFTLTFSDESTIQKQIGGFKTKRECLSARGFVITQLNNHEFVAFEVTVQEFYDYWLYYFMIDEVKISYQTYMTYRNIIYNYIIPKIGEEKLVAISRDTIINVLDSFPSKSLLALGYSVFGGSFKCAKKLNMIHSNYAPMAIKTKRLTVMKEQRNLNAVVSTQQNECLPRRRSLTSSQICYLIYLAKTQLPFYGYGDFYLPLLIACVTGCRISELIGFKFHFVSYTKKTIDLDTQLGRPVDDTGIEDGLLYKQEISTKSHSSVRSLPIPDFVIAEIVLAYERYQTERLSDCFHDDDFIWHQANGRPHGRSDYKKPFDLLKEWLNIPSDFHWHDLRHAFATIMVKNQVSLKELSLVLGHRDREGLFSLHTYVDGNQLIAEGVPEYMSMLEEITPIAISEDGSIYEKEEQKIIESPSVCAYCADILPCDLQNILAYAV